MVEPYNPWAELATPEFQQQDYYTKFLRFQELMPSYPDYMSADTETREYVRNQILGVRDSNELYKDVLNKTADSDSKTRNRVFTLLMHDDSKWQDQFALEDKLTVRKGLGLAMSPEDEYAPPEGHILPTRQLDPLSQDQIVQNLTEDAVRQEMNRISAEKQKAKDEAGVVYDALDTPYVRETIAPALSMVSQIPGQVAVSAGNVESLTAPPGTAPGRAVTPGFGREAFGMGAPPQQTPEEAEAIRAGVQELALKLVQAGEKQQAAAAGLFPEAEVQRYEDVEGFGDAVKYGLGVVSNMAGFVAQAAAGRAVGGPAGAFMAILPATMSEANEEVRRIAGDDLHPELVLPAAIASAGLEYAGFDQLTKAVTRPLRKKITNKIVGGALGMAQVGLIEGLTEPTQEGINIAIGRIVDENKKLFSRFNAEEMSRIKNAALGGLIGGLVLTGAGRTLRSRLSPEDQAAVDAAKEEAATLEQLLQTLVRPEMRGEQAIARGQQIAEGIPSELFEVPETLGATVLDAQGQAVKTRAPLERALEMVRGRQVPGQAQQEEGQPPVGGERRTGERRGLIPEDVRQKERLEFEERREAERRVTQEERGEEVTQEQADAARLQSLKTAEAGIIARLEEGGPIEGDTRERLEAVREEIRRLGGQPTQQVPQEETVQPPVRKLPETAGVIGGREFAERAIPQLEERITGLQQALVSAEALGQSDIYDGTYPVPEGGLLAAKKTNRYKRDSAYRDKIDDAIGAITDTMRMANRQRMTLLGTPDSGVFGVDYMVEKVKAGMTVPDATLAWNREAQTKYSGADYLGDIGIREGLQNGIDAVLQALNSGEIKSGQVDIEKDFDDAGFTIRDNGIGMSDVDIRDKFLALHQTGKATGGTVGGFGTGGAVLIAPTLGAQWEIQTRDNVHDSAKAAEFAQVGTLDSPRQGTQIVVNTGEKILSWLSDQFVETTEVPKNIKLTLNGKKVKNPFSRRKSKEHHFEIDDKTRLVVRYYPNAPDSYERKVVLRIVEPESGAKLTQGISHIGNSNSKGSLVVDIHSTEVAGTSKYPLTNDRLRLRWGGADRAVDSVIDNYAIDKLSGAAVEGSTLHKLTDRKEWQRVLRLVEADEGYANLIKTIEEIYERTGNYFGHDGPAYTPLKDQSVKITRGYKGYRGASLAHAKHLAAYEAVARLLVNHAETSLYSFYPLLSNTVISEYGGGNLGFNFLKPDLTALKTPLEYGMYLLDLVNHEFTHFFKGRHDEEFTSEMAAVQQRTSPRWWDVLKIAEAALGVPSEFISRLEHEAVLAKERAGFQEAEDARAKLAEQLPAEQLELIYEDMERETIGGPDDHLYYPIGSEQEKRGRQLELYGGGVDRGDAGLTGEAEPAGAGSGVQQPDTQGDVEAVEGRVGAGEQSGAGQPATTRGEPTGESAAAAAREASAAEAARKRRLDARGQHQKDVEKEAERKEKRKVKAEAKKKAKQQAFVPNEVQEKILAAIKGGLHTVSEIEAQTGIHKGALRRNFKTLAAAGEIVLGKQPTGRGDTDRQYATLPGEAVPEDVTPVDLKEEAAAKKEAKKKEKEDAEAKKETPFERVKRLYEQDKTEQELELEERERATQTGAVQLGTTKEQEERDDADFDETSDWRQRRWADWFLRGGPIGKGRTTAGQQRSLDAATHQQEGGIKEAQADRRLIDDHVRRLVKTRHDRARTGEVLNRYIAGDITAIETAEILDISTEDKAIIELGKLRDKNAVRSEKIKKSGHVPIDVAARWKNTFYLRLAYARFVMESRVLGRWRKYRPTETAKTLAIDTMEAGFKKAVERVAKETQEKALELPSSFDMVDFLKDTKHKRTQPMLEGLNNPELARKLEVLRETVQSWQGALEFERSIDGEGVRTIRHADGIRRHAADAVENLLSPRKKLEGGGLLKSTRNLEKRTLTEVFKQLYGEIKDPGVLQALTVETQSNILAQAQFFEDMLVNGEDLVWTWDKDHTVLKEKMGSKDSDSDIFKYGPLAGAYVTKEFKDYIDGKGRVHVGLRDLLNLGNPDLSIPGAVLGNTFGRLQAFTRKMALMALGTWNRNAVSSQLTFALSCGDALHPKFQKEFYKAAKTALKAWVGDQGGMRQLAKDMRAGAFTYKQSSLVNDFKPAIGPTAQRIWQGANPLMGAWNTLKNINRKSSELYVLLDYPAKKAAYNLRYGLAMKRLKNVTDEERKQIAEQHAREHVEKHYQNNDKVPMAIKQIGSMGGPDFISFRYDSARITTNDIVNVAVCSTPQGRKPSPKGSKAAKWKGAANEHPEIMDIWQPLAGFSAARALAPLHGLWGPGQYRLAFGSASAAMAVKGIKMVLAMTGAIKPEDEPEEKITEITPELMAAVNEFSPSYDANATKWAAQAEDKDGNKSVYVIPLNNQMASMPEDAMLGFAQRINSGGETMDEIIESTLRKENLGNFLPMTWSNIWEATTGYNPQTQFRQESLLQMMEDMDNGMTDDALEQGKGAVIDFIANTSGAIGRSYKKAEARERKAGRTPEKGVTGKRYDLETATDYLFEVVKPFIQLLRIKKLDNEEVLNIIPYKLDDSAGRVRGHRNNAREAAKNMLKWEGEEVTNEEIARSTAAMDGYENALRDAENRMAKMWPLVDLVGLSKETVIAQISDKSPLDQTLTRAEAEAIVYGKVEEYLKSDDMYKPEAKPTRLMKGDDIIRDMLIKDSHVSANHIVAEMIAEGYDIEKMYASEKYTPESRLRVKIRTLRKEIIEKKQTTTLYD